MKLLKRLFESKENNLMNQLLELDEYGLKKGYYSIDLKTPIKLGMNQCNGHFEMVDDKMTMKFDFFKYFIETGLSMEYATLFLIDTDEGLKVEHKGKNVRIDKKLIRKIKQRYEKILLGYQADQETRYVQFIKCLLEGSYNVQEKTIGSEGIEEAKELTFITDQGINLIFTREADSLLIKVKDSQQLYIRSLEYGLIDETFVSAKVRKINIPAEDKEQLMSFVKEYLSSKEVVRFFTEEEILLSKING